MERTLEPRTRCGNGFLAARSARNEWVPAQKGEQDKKIKIKTLGSVAFCSSRAAKKLPPLHGSFWTLFLSTPPSPILLFIGG